MFNKIKRSIDESMFKLSPKLPFTRMNIVCREIAKYSTGGTLLDLGCGDGRAMKLIAKKINGNFKFTGLDAFQSAINCAKEQQIYETLIVANIKDNLPFGEKSFDVVVLLEVLEHLSKDDGKKLLVTMESIARKALILSTPACLDRKRRGTVEEDIAYYTELNKDKPQEMPHISIWTPEEYEKYGFKVMRANGIHISGLPHYLDIVVGLLTAPFVYSLFPYLPASLVAVKTIELK